MRVLCTNDDGIRSPGLHALAHHLRQAGHDVLVAAPAEDLSGASASIGRLHVDHRIEMTTREIPGPDAMQGFAITGPPGLAAMAACLGAFGDPPDVVVSGINSGLNTGHSVLHSGTVGAALTAQNFGRRGLAVSIEPTDPWQWATACAYASPTLEWLAQHTPPRTVLNVNVPGRRRADVRGVRWAPLDQFGSVRAAVVEAGERGLQLEYRATGADLDPASDTALVEAGFVTLTAIAGIAEVDIGRDTPPGVEAESVGRELHEAPAPS